MQSQSPLQQQCRGPWLQQLLVQQPQQLVLVQGPGQAAATMRMGEHQEVACSFQSSRCQTGLLWPICYCQNMWSLLHWPSECLSDVAQPWFSTLPVAIHDSTLIVTGNTQYIGLLQFPMFIIGTPIAAAETCLRWMRLIPHFVHLTR